MNVCPDCGASLALEHPSGRTMPRRACLCSPAQRSGPPTRHDAELSVAAIQAAIEQMRSDLQLPDHVTVSVELAPELELLLEQAIAADLFDLLELGPCPELPCPWCGAGADEDCLDELCPQGPVEALPDCRARIPQVAGDDNCAEQRVYLAVRVWPALLAVWTECWR